jgi:phosphoribosylaminoimidazolecarboxamide formyltransferase/IMP cyclohydrolase
VVEEELLKDILDNQFVELIIAPKFSEQSIEYAKSKKNIRIIEYLDNYSSNNKNFNQLKTISDGFLIQQEDYSKDDFIKNYQVVSDKVPTDKEFDDLYFAWVVAKFVKSNAIVFVKDKKTLGIGAGQMSRIDSTFIASTKATNQKIVLKDAVMASDAFFPFFDNVEKAAELGISSIIQPGGSQNDNQVIKKANELNISLVFTGIRHFRH